MEQTLSTLATMSDEELAAQGYSPDTIQKIRTSAGTNAQPTTAGFSAAPMELETFVEPATSEFKLPKPIPPPKKSGSAEKKSGDKASPLKSMLMNEGEEASATAEPVETNTVTATAETPAGQVPGGTSAPATQAQILPNGQILESGQVEEKRVGQSMLDKQRKAADEAIEKKKQKELAAIQEKEINKARMLGISPEQFAQLKNQYGANPEAAEQMVGPDETDAAATPEEQAGFKTTFDKLMAMQSRQNSSDNTFSRLMAEQDRKIAELQKKEVDPKRYWNSRTSGEKAWTMIGVMFSQKGGSNSAMNMLQNEITRDVNLQKEKMDNELKILQIGNDKLKIASTLAKKGTNDTRALSHELNVIDATIEQGKRLASKPKANPEAVAQMMGSLQERRATVEAQLADSLNAGARLSDDLVGPSTPRHLMDDKQQERFVPGYGLARNPASAEKFATYESEMKGASDGLKRAVALADKTQKLNPYSQDRALLEQELVATIGALRLPFTGPGPLLEAEYERIKSVIGNPNSILSMNSIEKAKLLNVVKKLDNDVDNRAAVTFNGYKPKSQQFSTFKPK